MDELPPVKSGGYLTPHSFARKWTFCEALQLLGGIALSQVDLWKYAPLLYQAHSSKTHARVARAEWEQVQDASG